MKESIGGAWLFGVIVAFMMIFVGYLVIMINYTTAFKLKNEVVHVIERYEGLSSGDNGSVKIINQYLKNSKYNAVGTCECETANSCYGATDLDNANLTQINNSNKNDRYYYCVQFYNTSNADNPNTGFYETQLFLNFNLPVLGRIAKITIRGQTIKMKYPIDYV